MDNMQPTNGQMEVDSPFLNEYSFEAPANSKDNLRSSMEPELAIGSKSPFINAYERFDSEEATTPEEDALAELLAELHDEEFNEMMEEMADEAVLHYEDQFALDYGSVPQTEREAVRVIEEYFQPFQQELDLYAEGLVDFLQGKGQKEIEQADVEELLREYEEGEAQIDDPNFEQFRRLRKRFKKFGKRLRRVGKKIVKGVKKAAKGLNPFFLLKKFIRKWGRKLLNRIAKFALKKLPKKYHSIIKQLQQALAGKLRKRELGVEESESYPLAELVQQEMDIHLAQFLQEFERGPAMDVDEDLYLDQFFTTPGFSQETDEPDLQTERELFVRQLLELDADDDPEPLIQNFVGAIMKGAKILLKIVGRKRVVKGIARLGVRLIQALSKKFGKNIDRKKITPIVRLMVDKGLKAIGLEIPAQMEAEVAGHALASVLQETVQRLEDLPDSVAENEELLESYVVQAFEQAVAANFPPMLSEEAYIRYPYLKQSARGGFWAPVSVGRNRALYKKFSKTFDLELTPQLKEDLLSFRGIPLGTVLRDRMGIPIGKSVQARIHLFETLPGGDLVHISRYERGIPGLGKPTLQSNLLFHPLTHQAASVLLREPALGCRKRSCLNHYRTHSSGHRVYFIELPGQMMGSIDPGIQGMDRYRATQLQLRVDLMKNAVRAYLFLSEAEARILASQLGPGGVAYGASRHLGDRLAAEFQPQLFTAGNRAKVIHPSLPTAIAAKRLAESLPPWLLQRFLNRLRDEILGGLIRYLQSKADTFRAAVEHPENGITLCFYLDSFNDLESLARTLNQGKIPDRQTAFTGSALGLKITTKAGYHHVG